MTGPRFVEIPADRLLGALRAIGAAVEGRGGVYLEATAGREIMAVVVPPGGRAEVRVFTSIAKGAKEARDCGEDAVRIVVGVQTPERWRPLEAGRKVLRTAPKNAPDRVEAFLVRFRGEVREAYVRARLVPACPRCGRAMAIRTAKTPAGKFRSTFLGCIGYPECRGTRNMEE